MYSQKDWNMYTAVKPLIDNYFSLYYNDFWGCILWFCCHAEDRIEKNTKKLCSCHVKGENAGCPSWSEGDNLLPSENVRHVFFFFFKWKINGMCLRLNLRDPQIRSLRHDVKPNCSDKALIWGQICKTLGLGQVKLLSFGKQVSVQCVAVGLLVLLSEESFISKNSLFTTCSGPNSRQTHLSVVYDHLGH